MVNKMSLTCCPEIKLNRDKYYKLEKDIEIETGRYRYMVLDVRKAIRGFVKDGSGRLRRNVITANFFSFLTAFLDRGTADVISIDGSIIQRSMSGYFYPYRSLAKNEAVTCTFTSQTISGQSTFTHSVGFRPNTNYRELLIQSTPTINYQQMRISWDVAGFTINHVCQCYSVSGMAGTPFTASLTYAQPWTRFLPISHWMVANSSTMTIQDIYGNNITPRLTTPHTVAASEIVIDVSTQTSDAEALYFESPIILSTSRSRTSSPSVPSWFSATSVFSPSSAMNVSAFGLSIQIYDTGGATRRVLLIRKNLDRVINVGPSKPMLLSIRVYGL